MPHRVRKLLLDLSLACAETIIDLCAFRKSTPVQIALKGNRFRLAINGCIKSECSDFIHGVVSRTKLILSLSLAWSALPYLHAL